MIQTNPNGMQHMMNDSTKTKYLRLFLALFLFPLFLSSRAEADVSPPVGVKSMTAPADSSSVPYDWCAELSSGVAFGNIRDESLDGHTTVPINLTISLPLDEVSLDDFAGGYFRGYTEFLFRGMGQVVSGAEESALVGGGFGPRYNFVQEGWPLVPYVEAVVGFYFADSSPRIDATGKQFGLGQDFNFTFSVATGVRYDIDERWFTRLAIVYTHISNADLSEPDYENKAVDTLGPEVSLGFKF